MRRLLKEGNAFSDVAIQIKYGSGISGIHLNYHVDTFNSLLHMGVALAGKRSLYARHTPEEGEVVEYSSLQPPGGVYLTSPAAFQHAPGHAETLREDRIVAVQCRVI